MKITDFLPSIFKRNNTVPEETPLLFGFKNNERPRLQEIAQKTNVIEIQQVISDAIRTYEAIVSNQEKGIVFWAQLTPHGELVPVEFIRNVGVAPAQKNVLTLVINNDVDDL